MFVSVILDVDYYGPEGRQYWVLKNAFHSLKNNTLIITHECFKDFKKYADLCEDRFYDEFEMKKLSHNEVDKLNIEYINDKLFDDLEKQFCSRTQLLLYLFRNRCIELENQVKKIIDSRNEKVECIFTSQEGFKSINQLGKDYNCPVISYSFSAIRKMHGYRKTLYLTGLEGTLKNVEDLNNSFLKYKNRENRVSVIFSKRELLALFGKEKNIPLISVMNSKPIHDFGICKTPNNIYAQDFIKYEYTDTDLYYEVKKGLNTTDIEIRNHPNIPWNGTDKAEIKEHVRNDPLSFILSCKRVSSVDSMILLKSVLWNRVTIAKGGLQSIEFLCGNDVNSNYKPSDEKINYYMFFYLIPDKMMFDRAYWEWRLCEKPSEYEIYKKNLNYYIDEFNLDINLLEKLEEKERFQYILEKRGVEKTIINHLIIGNTCNVEYEVLSSRLDINYDAGTKIYFCLNKRCGDIICSKYDVNVSKKENSLKFYPLFDIGGFVKLISFSINGNITEVKNDYRYMKKNIGYFEIENKDNIEIKSVEISWRYYFI